MIRAFQWDLARQVERLEVLLGLLPRYAEWGYQELYLHLEDAVEYPSFPDIARSDAYSRAQLARLVAKASQAGIGVVPIVNLLGHTQYLIKTPGLRDLNELRSPDGHPLDAGQICPLHPRTLEVADRLIGDMAPFCTAGKIHVGLDESFSLGKCPRCQADIAAHGLAGHFAGHVTRLHGLTRRRGLRLGIWADMLNFIPEAIGQLPRDIIAYDWYYYPFRRHPKVELFNFREVDLATPLRARGIEYWGCPMNGAFRYEPLPLFRDRLANIRSWWERCWRVGAAGMLVTSWEAYRLAFELPAVVDAAAASLWLGPPGETSSDAALLATGFARVFDRGRRGERAGAKTAAWARLALAADKYPFAGYARWEANEHWDGADPGASRALRAECRHFRRLVQLAKAGGAPASLQSSLAFRAYLAQRDEFISESAAGVIRLRRTLSRGNLRSARPIIARLLRHAAGMRRALPSARTAAGTMWNLTRDPPRKAKNSAILERDEERLDEWTRWLRGVAADAAAVWTASPVFGVWQVHCRVINSAPALQRVSIEEQGADGLWRELRGRHTIEFQAAGANSRAVGLERFFSVPVTHPDAPLKLVVRGLGEVRITHLTLSNGVIHLAPRRRVFKLGTRAPTSGWPDIRQLGGELIPAFE